MEEESQSLCMQFIKVEANENTIYNTETKEERNVSFVQQEIKEESNSQLKSNFGLGVDHFLTSNDAAEVTDITECFIKEEKFYDESEQVEDIEVEPEIPENIYDSIYTGLEDNKYNMNTEGYSAESFADSSGVILLSLLQGNPGSSNYNRTSVPDEQRLTVSQCKVNTCQECCKSFSSQYNLKSHINTVHKMIKAYQCNVCDKSFPSLQKRNLHITRVHERIKEYSCNQCEKTFCSKYDLKRHVYSVHMEVKFKCDFCPKMFSQLSRLNYHISSLHKEIKKFGCQKCSQKFYRLEELNYHVSTIHENTKKFVCEECFKRFNRASQLNRHIDIVHKKIKKYCCDECEKRFPHLPNLRYHINAMHIGIKCYECIECDKKFPYLSTLKMHIKAKHDIEINLL